MIKQQAIMKIYQRKKNLNNTIGIHASQQGKIREIFWDFSRRHHLCTQIDQEVMYSIEQLTRILTR